MVAVAFAWLLLAGIYLALVGNVSPVEAVAALLCGGLGALWVRQIRRCGALSLRLRLSAVTPLRPVLAGLPLQTRRVGTRLWRAALKGDVSGEDRAVPLPEIANGPSRADDPDAAGARALFVLAASLSPDAYVLRREPERGRVLVHAFLSETDGARTG